MTASNSQLAAAGDEANGSFGYNDVGNAVQPCSKNSPPTTVDPQKPHWIEIMVQDKEGNPVVGQDYEIRLPNGQLATGTTDERGVARIDGIDPGNCRIRFPSLDKTVWNRK
jgi:hypothetical protein